MLLTTFRKIKGKIQHARMLRIAEHCGVGTKIDGSLEVRKSGGTIRIGNGCLVSGYLVTERPTSQISLGNNTLVGSATVIDCVEKIEIGDDVLISYQCIIGDSDNHSLYREQRKKDLYNWMTDQEQNWDVVAIDPIRIDNGAWVGARSIILKGVRIGEGAVVGMGSVVTKNVAPYTVVGGNPAGFIMNLPRK